MVGLASNSIRKSLISCQVFLNHAMKNQAWGWIEPGAEARPDRA